MRRLVLSFVLLMSGWLGAAPSADAGCLGVSCSCSINASPISFGTYNPMAAGNVDVAANISVSCTSFALGLLISYNIHLGAGLHGTVLDRKMSNGASLLAYNLYTNAQRTTVWGNGTGGTGQASRSYLLVLGGQRTDNFSVYGRMPGSQNVSAGAYADTIVATVIY